MILNIRVGSVSDARGLGIAHIFAFDSIMFALEPASLHAKLLPDDTIRESTRSEETWKVLEWWMKRCKENCGCLCAPKVDFGLSRILEFGNMDDPQVFLRSEDELPARISYVTLSHCWGGVILC